MSTDEDWLKKYQPNAAATPPGPYKPPNYATHSIPGQHQIPGQREIPGQQQPQQAPQQGFPPAPQSRGPWMPPGQPLVQPIGGGSALAFGLVSWVPILGFLGIAAILLGTSALKRAANANQGVPPLPLAGIIAGSMGLGATLFILITYFAFGGA